MVMFAKYNKYFRECLVLLSTVVETDILSFCNKTYLIKEVNSEITFYIII